MKRVFEGIGKISRPRVQDEGMMGDWANFRVLVLHPRVNIAAAVRQPA